MTNYELLLKTLESVASEAPENLSVYQPENDDQLVHCRARCSIHLFLRVQFGIIDFDVVESQITDGSNDGGLDAYHIDEEEKMIYLIQSKFANTQINFEDRSVDSRELFRMQLDRIIRGETGTEEGRSYNGKIHEFQRKIQDITDIARYTYQLVYLGRISGQISDNQLLQVTGGVCNGVTRIDGRSYYSNILLPFIQNNFYNKSELILKIRVNQNQSNRISYRVNVDDSSVNINLSFVPTLEIAKCMSEYKNSVLKYNPRCYVGLRKGGVNDAIQTSLLAEDSNDFALLNNGITILCSDFEYTDRNAEPDSATLLITNPQIVNGGQTAFTLAHLLEEQGEEIFDGNEVLVKFISIVGEGENQELIEKISEATNNQTPVKLEDRISNDEVLIWLQHELFNCNNILLERKKGEFYGATQNKLVNKEDILQKDDVVRGYLASIGRASMARRGSSNSIFQSTNLEEIRDYGVSEVAFNVSVAKYLKSLEERSGSQREKYRIDEYGYALRYGKYAVMFAVARSKQVNESAQEVVDRVLSRWLDFENTAENKELNSIYTDDGFNYDNYYKGRTVDRDIGEYFSE